MNIDLWKVTTIIAGVIFITTFLNNSVVTGAFVSGKPVLELFVMSQCPYGIYSEQYIAEVLDAFGDSIDFRLNFIAGYSNGVFQSLHGQGEVEEDLRQVCAMKYYPNTYFNYVLCYDYEYTLCSESYSTCLDSGGADCSEQYSSCMQNIDWETCASVTGLAVETISNCYQGAEGEQLLIDNIKRANELGIMGSETFALDGVELERTYRWSPESMKQLICNKYPNLNTCSSTLSSGTGGTTSGNC